MFWLFTNGLKSVVAILFEPYQRIKIRCYNMFRPYGTHTWVGGNMN